MTHDQRFLAGLSSVLAHSMVYFSRTCVKLMACGGTKVNNTSESVDSMMRSYIANLPKMLSTTAANVLPTEQALLDASSVISPQQAQLETDLYRTYGPQINQIGSDIARQNALAQAGSDLAVLQGPGKDLAASAVAAQKVADPEYYAARAQAMEQLSRLFGSLQDPSGGLSGSERAEVERAIARREANAGSLGTPTNIGTVQAGMDFGKAGEDRRAAKQTAIANSVGAATSFLPTAKSGIDVFQVATGRSSQPNTGESRLSGTADVGNSTFATGNNLFNNIGALQQQNNSLTANKKTGLDQISQVAGITGSVCCWTFMEVYGNQQIPWFVRAIRDSVSTPAMGRGYKWTSQWLVPLMHRHKLIKQLVQSFMVGPLTIYAGWLTGQPGYEHGRIYRNHNKFWLSVWTLLGKTVARNVKLAHANH